MPRVSVIVPNYNHARFLRQRIESILAQTYQDFELILLDDCSTDESREILKEYVTGPKPAYAGEVVAGVKRGASTERGLSATQEQAVRSVDVRLVVNETNSGSTFKQWNRGVGLARGKYVWIAESDDYAEARFLERLVRLLEADERVVVVYCRSHKVVAGKITAGQENLRKWRKGEAVEGVAGDGKVDGFAYPLLDPPDVERWATDFCAEGIDECRRYFPVANLVRNASSAVFRKDAYEAAGGADESLRFCGDWKLWAGMALRGKMAYVSEPLNYYRLHAGSVWGNRSGAAEIEELLRVARWVMEQAAPTDEARETANRKLSFGWVMVLMSRHVAVDRKRAMWRDVKAIDAHPMRRVLRPALKTIGMKIRRHWRELGWRAAPTRTSP